MNPATEPFGAKGTAVAKRDVDGEYHRCSRFLHTREIKNKTTLKARYHRCSRAIHEPQAAPRGTKESHQITRYHRCSRFSHTKEAKNKTTLKASYHRCSRAINKLQAGTNRAQREPSDHKLSPVFLVFRTRERRRTKQHRKQAITGVLVQSKAPTRAPRRLKKN